MTPTRELEAEVRKRAGDGALYIAGIDEVGVGALAGPVIAAAVVLLDDFESLPGDSKQCTGAQRKELFEIIKAAAVAIGIGHSSPLQVDTLGIARAKERAIVKAFAACRFKLSAGLKIARLAAVVDDRRLGRLRSQLGGACSVFADKADERSVSVAAASIVAKVLRDRYMTRVGLFYQDYEFHKNKGYGTPRHLAALRELGPCPIHRLSFSPCRIVSESQQGIIE